MEIITLPIESLTMHKGNAKLHPQEQIDQIKESIKLYGFNDPIGIWGKKNTIVEGHGRYMAAKEMGLIEVPCIRLDHLSDKQRREYMLVHNQTTMNSGWDFDLLTDELNGLDFDGFDFGFDIDDDEPGEVVEDDYDAEPPVEPKANLGDIYQLGRHRLMCGDSTKAEDVEKLMDGQKADMVFTDPPYELETKGGGILKKANSMTQIRENGVDKFDPDMLSLYAKTNIFFHNKSLIKKYIDLAERENVAYDLCVYAKENTAPNYNGHMMTDIEYIAIIGEQDPNKGLDKAEYSKVYFGKKDSDNGLSYSKPIALCKKFIKLYSKKDGIVLDLFGGSGSTLIACEQLERACYMMELSPQYIDVIIDRWEKFTGEKAVKVN